MGELHIITGPMFSGKSSELIRIINRYKVINKKILVVNHLYDTRYSSDSICSHNKQKIKCLLKYHLNELYNNKEYIEAEIIFIDEGHLFENLLEFVLRSIDENNKIVYIAGLNGDYQRNPIGEINTLLPHCNTIKKLTAFCKYCGDGTPAHFTKRLIKETTQIFIGDNTVYEAVCREHFK